MTDLVRLTSAPSAAEAEMIAALLRAEGINVLVQRPPGFDVPEFLGGGPRLLLVRADQHAAAAELVEAHFGLN